MQPKDRSRQLFERARRVLAGGVNSPVRAFGTVGGDPRFVDRAEGPFIFDADGDRYVDLVCSWGASIVGHAHPAVVGAIQVAAARGLSFGACCEAEAQLAEIIIAAFPSIDLLRCVNSGTEAAMSALRVARGATGRRMVLKFAGCYHGHVDSLLVSAGSGAAAHGIPDSAGVPAEFAATTLVSPYNDLAAVEHLMAERGCDVAAIIVEPIAGNMGYIEPAEGFLQGLRAICDRHGSLLIFDEVMTGFRVAWGGYQNLCAVRPDLTCLGKVIGGGMPVAAYGGRRDLMELVSPMGPVYQAGTLSGNPLGMAAGLATLRLCREPGFYERLAATSAAIVHGWKSAALDAGVSVQGGSCGGLLGITFADRPPRDFSDARGCDHQRYAEFFHAMTDHGVWLPPSGYEAMFVTSAHEDTVESIVAGGRSSLRSLRP